MIDIFIYFFKKLKNKLNIKLMEILLEAEKTKLPKEVINNLEDFFELFDELKWFEKIVVGIIFFSIYCIFILLDSQSVFSYSKMIKNQSLNRN